MFACLFILHITGILEIGLSELYRRAVAGGRLNFLDPNLSGRYTVWNVLARGLCLSLGFFGTNQIQVQRFLSMSECKRSQS
ncbi:hypothetical protein AVEN_35981-1 [Araneus ventricosus]|uniref:Uncharacterized protein n=1 Tax=Araneus ventricosus TaxID=182803 RepID=A0A4Y2FHD9_ARAVE|nr:hypothetical protein AVEN_91577-1 [Araneus ventricosus]GBM40920.1 hypothetical protein AVEN_35981-1 [Araneus ventricosus]